MHPYWCPGSTIAGTATADGKEGVAGRGSAVLDVLDHCAETGHIPVSLPFQSRHHSSVAGQTSVRSN